MKKWSRGCRLSMSSFCRASETWMERHAHQKTVWVRLWVVSEEQDVPFRLHLYRYYKSTSRVALAHLPSVSICKFCLSCNLSLCRRAYMVVWAHSIPAAFGRWPCCHCWKTWTKTAHRGLKHKSQQTSMSWRNNVLHEWAIIWGDDNPTSTCNALRILSRLTTLHLPRSDQMSEPPSKCWEKSKTWTTCMVTMHMHKRLVAHNAMSSNRDTRDAQPLYSSVMVKTKSMFMIKQVAHEQNACLTWKNAKYAQVIYVLRRPIPLSSHWSISC